jgi:hypothetical protein
MSSREGSGVSRRETLPGWLDRGVRAAALTGLARQVG